MTLQLPDFPRLKFIDFDARRDPKTERWCIMCQRDLKRGSGYRYVNVVEFMQAVHPDDYSLTPEAHESPQ